MNERIQPLAIQTYIKLAQQKNVISLGAGLPDLSVLPVKQLKEIYSELGDEVERSFQYQPPSIQLQEKIQNLMLAKGVSCSLDEILITSGAQQGIFLTAGLWFKEKASLMIEEFVYPGFLQVANMYDLNYIPIPAVFNEGIDLNYLESVLKTKKVLPYLYLVCNGHNPQGVTFNTPLRKELAALADRYNFIIIEDDPYGYLSLTDETFLPMRAYTRNAVYISSFSKILAPGLRTGWIVAEKEVIEKLEQFKDINDLYVSNPNHLAINKLLENHSLAEITAPQISLYKKKRDCMLSALDEYMDVEHHYVLPKHGMFLWLEFPNLPIERFKERLFEQSRVLFIPGSAFSVQKIAIKQAMRLNFTYPSFETIRLGIKLLSDALLDLPVQQSAKITKADYGPRLVGF